MPERFVPCHPISGSEKAGLRRQTGPCLTAVRWFTPLDNTSDAAQQACADFWQALGATTLQLGFAEHDAALAVTSHLPHLLAFAFMEQVEEPHLAFNRWRLRFHTHRGSQPGTVVAHHAPEPMLAGALEQYSGQSSDLGRCHRNR